MPTRDASVVVGMMLVASAAAAREWVSEEHKCAITYPDEGWELQTDRPVPNTIFVVSDADATRTVGIGVMKSPDGSRIDEGFAKGVERGTLKIRPPVKAGRKLRGAMTTVGGLPAYEFVARYELEDCYSIVIQRSVIANGRLYMINSTVFDGDPSRDSETTGILSSFRFTSPPQAPKGKEGFAYRMGELAAYLLMGALALAVLKRIFVRGKTKGS